jgi:hypothetical protein
MNLHRVVAILVPAILGIGGGGCDLTVYGDKRCMIVGTPWPSPGQCLNPDDTLPQEVVAQRDFRGMSDQRACEVLWKVVGGKGAVMATGKYVEVDCVCVDLPPPVKLADVFRDGRVVETLYDETCSQCPSSDSDSGCRKCGNSLCCDAVQTCDADSLCWDWTTCINNGGTAATCTALWGSNEATDAIYTCATVDCAAECGWVSSAQGTREPPSVPGGSSASEDATPLPDALHIDPKDVPSPGAHP